MSTRSIVTIKDEKKKKIIEIYIQYDGYPEGVGKDLLDFIATGKMVNGIGKDPNVFNGIGCFAAQLVAHLKNCAGDVYLHAPSEDYKNKNKYNENYWASYYYEIDSNLRVRCWDCYNNQEIDLENTKE